MSATYTTISSDYVEPALTDAIQTQPWWANIAFALAGAAASIAGFLAATIVR
jgi:hypothetical protein